MGDVRGLPGSPSARPSITRILLIGNPAAGLRPRTGLLGQLAERLRARGMRPELHETRGPGDAKRAAARAAADGRFEAIVAVGGDGTAHEVANGLADTGVPMAVVPAGTMNILARELGLPLDPLRAAEAIPDLMPCPVTAGRVEGGPFFLLMAGVGFDAYALAIALGRAGGRKVTFTAYTVAALVAARRYGYGMMRVECGAESWLGSSAIVGNVPRYGGNLRLTPQARLTDAVLDLCLLRGEGFRSYLSVFRDVLLAGRHVRRHDVVYRRAERFVLTPAPEAPRAGSRTRTPLLQLDGEAAGAVEGPLVIEARPRAITLLAPPGFS